MPRRLRERALDQAMANERTLACIALWRALAGLLATCKEQDGRLRVLPPDRETGYHVTEMMGVKAIHASMRGKPVLHLDATLRPALAHTVLPHLETHEIVAAAPHMDVRLVGGSFGKGRLCQAADAAPEENRRRANRLRECVDYVRWHARRLAPGKVLVITYKQCEPAFSGIPGVSTAHFNAIAGLDAYRDVRLLVVVGRPLPPEPELRILAGAFFGHVPAPSAGYRHAIRGVLMRDGSTRGARAIEHEDEQAEVLRAAICDDELVQAVGRGRGVNRTAADPLEVHLLADVTLPLVHDRVLAWETVVPDIIQRMLLAGIAVDSPGDAAVLHAGRFAGEKQAQKALERAGFKRQIPLGNTYREMSLKSAAYRRAGRGRSWARAWWIAGSEDDPLAQLNQALGDVAAWKPD